MMDYHDTMVRAAIAELTAILAKPDPQYPDPGNVDEFDPWDLFDCLYGSYSSEFDDLAIDVLRHVCGEKKYDPKEYGLAFEMFQEMLCAKKFCDYGTSPRYCFAASPEIKELLAKLLERWRVRRDAFWAEPET